MTAGVEAELSDCRPPLTEGSMATRSNPVPLTSRTPRTPTTYRRISTGFAARSDSLLVSIWSKSAARRSAGSSPGGIGGQQRDSRIYALLNDESH